MVTGAFCRRHGVMTCVPLQHKLLSVVTDNRPLLELIREAKAEVTVEEKDIDEADMVVSCVLITLKLVSK